MKKMKRSKQRPNEQPPPKLPERSKMMEPPRPLCPPHPPLLPRPRSGQRVPPCASPGHLGAAGGPWRGRRVGSRSRMPFRRRPGAHSASEATWRTTTRRDARQRRQTAQRAGTQRQPQEATGSDLLRLGGCVAALALELLARGRVVLVRKVDADGGKRRLRKIAKALLKLGTLLQLAHVILHTEKGGRGRVRSVRNGPAGEKTTREEEKGGNGPASPRLSTPLDAPRRPLPPIAPSCPSGAALSSPSAGRPATETTARFGRAPVASRAARLASGPPCVPSADTPRTHERTCASRRLRGVRDRRRARSPLSASQGPAPPTRPAPHPSPPFSLPSGRSENARAARLPR